MKASGAFVASLSVSPYSQSPFKLSQSARTICGRGYSGHAFVGETSLAQRVNIGTLVGIFQSSPRHTLLSAATVKIRSHCLVLKFFMNSLRSSSDY